MTQPNVYAGVSLLSSLTPPQDAGTLHLRNTLGKYRNDFVLVGMCSQSRMHLLFPGSDENYLQLPNAPRFHGLQISEREIVYGDSLLEKLVDISTDADFDISLFGAIVDEFVNQIQDHADPLALLIKILEKWQSLLAIQEGGLQKSVAIGLFGELLVLESLRNGSDHFDISSWTGPLRHRHDFEFSSCALEVKTSTRTDQNIVRIHGLDQLTSAVDSSLKLAFIRLEWNPTGRSLKDLISNISEFLDDPEPLSTMLEELGVGPSAEIDKFKFQLVDAHLFNVDEHFPKITSQQIAMIMSAERLVDVDYSLNLTGLHSVDITDLTKLSGELHG